MTYEEFWNRVLVELWPAQYKLYFVFNDPERERVKLTKETFREIFRFIVDESLGHIPISYGVVYSFEYSEFKEESPPLKLTAHNLRLLHTNHEEKRAIEAEDEDTVENDTESVQTRDSNLQREMNTEVTFRDSSTCVICRRPASDVDLQAAHIFELRERKQMPVSTWLSTKSKFKIDSLYGPKNGFSECTLCHKMHDRKLLSIECSTGSSGTEYRIRCEPGTLCLPTNNMQLRSTASLF